MNFNKIYEDSYNDRDLENDFEHFEENFSDEVHFSSSFNSKDIEENLSEEVHISTSLSSKKIMELIDKYPNLKIVTCPKSIYNRISKKYLEVLEKLGIKVEIKYNWGKSSKYEEKHRINVVNLIKKGFSPKDIGQKLDMPVQTVYYLKNKNKKDQIKLKRGKRKKYSFDTREKVRKLANDGVPKKEISENENIPLRTVYDIINEK